MVYWCCTGPRGLGKGKHDVLILGHRGASKAHPENTLQAFAAAYEGGAQGLEFDVRADVNGVPVISHDRSLERRASDARNVDELTVDELKTTVHGILNRPVEPGDLPLAVLVHGLTGCAESHYMRASAAILLRRGLILLRDRGRAEHDATGHRCLSAGR